MHIVVVRNNSNPQAIDASLMVMAYCQSQGIELSLVDAASLERVANDDDRRVLRGAPVDLAIALGGDGTLLHTAHLMEDVGAPILGINFGHLGFLSNPGDDGVIEALTSALSGDVVVEERTNLSIEVVCEGEEDPYTGETLAADVAPVSPLRDEELAREVSSAHRLETHEAGENGIVIPTTSKRTFFALNELVVARGALGYMITFSFDVAGSHVADMRGDGLVVATATGSTAYALSAGGPLVAPGFRGLVVVPLAPHSLQSRAVLTDPSDVVEVSLIENPADREATLFVDGEILSFERPVRRVYVKRGETPTTLLRYKGESFYEHAARVFFKSQPERSNTD